MVRYIGVSLDLRGFGMDEMDERRNWTISCGMGMFWGYLRVGEGEMGDGLGTGDIGVNMLNDQSRQQMPNILHQIYCCFYTVQTFQTALHGQSTPLIQKITHFPKDHTTKRQSSTPFLQNTFHKQERTSDNLPHCFSLRKNPLALLICNSGYFVYIFIGRKMESKSCPSVCLIACLVIVTLLRGLHITFVVVARQFIDNLYPWEALKIEDKHQELLWPWKQLAAFILSASGAVFVLCIVMMISLVKKTCSQVSILLCVLALVLEFSIGVNLGLEASRASHIYEPFKDTDYYDPYFARFFRIGLADTFITFTFSFLTLMFALREFVIAAIQEAVNQPPIDPPGSSKSLQQLEPVGSTHALN